MLRRYAYNIVNMKARICVLKNNRNITLFSLAGYIVTGNIGKLASIKFNNKKF